VVEFCADHMLRFHREQVMSEDDLRKLIGTTASPLRICPAD
jgi:hypothetical protein